MLMYGHLIEGAGPAIHLAYRATKRQTEKGPVDVFTGEARHSLAKEKILTQLADMEDMKVSKQQHNNNNNNNNSNVYLSLGERRCDNYRERRVSDS